MTLITGLTTHDLRFPTSDALDGSDAMNPDPTIPPPMSCWKWMATIRATG